MADIKANRWFSHWELIFVHYLFLYWVLAAGSWLLYGLNHADRKSVFFKLWRFPVTQKFWHVIFSSLGQCGSHPSSWPAARPRLLDPAGISRSGWNLRLLSMQHYRFHPWSWKIPCRGINEALVGATTQAEPISRAGSPARAHLLKLLKPTCLRACVAQEKPLQLKSSFPGLSVTPGKPI